jgi:RimJ/RimL family protein N-acetyltransferase
MRHLLETEGFGVRLRPVRMEDAAFIVWLRNLDHVKGKVGDSAVDVASQEAWLKAYFEREGDYYFIIETLGGTAVGAYGIYDVVGTSAESGRWIIRPEVPAALPSAVLGFNLAFKTLGMDELRVTTVSSNLPVLSLNRKFGFRQTRLERGGRIINGKPVDMVHFILTAEDWSKPRERLTPLAQLAENQVREWELTRPRSEHRH